MTGRIPADCVRFSSPTASSLLPGFTGTVLYSDGFTVLPLFLDNQILPLPDFQYLQYTTATEATQKGYYNYSNKEVDP